MNSSVSSFTGHSGRFGDIVRISLGLCSKEYILASSYGEIKKPETINYRTLKPERDGLFCARIFGPVKSYECMCGKYKRVKHRGAVCDKCGVEVTDSSVRRERMGHIELACPVAHIWFLRSLPSKIGLLLDMSVKDLEMVLYHNRFVVVDPGISPLDKGTLMTEEAYLNAQQEHGEDSFSAMIGGEAVKQMLQDLDLPDLAQKLASDLRVSTSEIKKKKFSKRLKVVQDIMRSDNKPEWMMVEALPVLPPDLRPLVMLDGGRFATSDLNELYRRVINRNNRLKRLIVLAAPDIIIRNEKRMLQEAVDMLFYNGRRNRVIRNAGKRPYKSLTDMIKGKQGRFRQNLLGKRVDYSGRSVIVTGSKLALYQCGLPKKMALELFKPFIYSKLEMYGYAATVKVAKGIVDMERPEVWDILDEVIKEHPVLLNRAPTLHRMSIQAFEPILIEGNAIQLHPLVCTAFNADFDGDQMAVHVPLSLEAQVEAKVLMMSVNNILNPANGRPIVVPSKDMVLGIYYLSLECILKEGQKRRIFDRIGEIENCLEYGTLTLHEPIIYRINQLQEDGTYQFIRYNTTPGRVMLFALFPEHPGLTLDVVNTVLDSKAITAIVGLVYKKCGQLATAQYVDKLKDIGFEYATLSGVSFGKDDMVIPKTKGAHIAKATEEVNKFELQYQEGLITAREKRNKAIDVWSKCVEAVSDDMMQVIAVGLEKGIVTTSVVELNSIFMMAHSGARGSAAQMKQLAGMRGLMSTPSGEIIERPILSNFKEGLSVLEYFNSTHGARKGLSDTALKTANSGYLTRRLVDVAQECIVYEVDCNSDNGITMSSVIDGGEVIVSLADLVTGRVCAVDVYNPITNELIIKTNELIDEKAIQKLNFTGIDSIKVRSPITCLSKHGVCTRCYGIDLSNGQMVSVGEPVGVIAAQSIGEPGTQLTMRTFHIGGAATKRAEISHIEAVVAGKVHVVGSNVVINSSGDKIMMSRACEVILYDETNSLRSKYNIPYGAKMFVCDGDTVQKGDKITSWDPYTMPIITEKGGVVKYCDLVYGVSVSEVVDEVTGIASRVLVDWRNTAKTSDLRPNLALCDQTTGEVVKLHGDLEARYFMPVGAILNISDGQVVHAGDVLARMPLEFSRTRDITGGLPKVAELFEARKPKDHSIISDVDGYVSVGRDYKAKRKLIITPTDGGEPSEYLIPRGKYVTVSEGAFVRRGALLMDGSPDLHDVLRVMGIDALAYYVLSEIQKIYRMQGVHINSKHIEIIVCQMTKKILVTDPGDTDLLTDHHIDLHVFAGIVERCIAQDQEPPKGNRVLQGITRAGLQTDSFIAAASFQETVKVLSDAAVGGKVDDLKSLKENVIVGGRLIPAGTGHVVMTKAALAKRRRIAREANTNEATPAS